MVQVQYCLRFDTLLIKSDCLSTFRLHSVINSTRPILNKYRTVHSAMHTFFSNLENNAVNILFAI